jgi:hypothetical protein
MRHFHSYGPVDYRYHYCVHRKEIIARCMQSVPEISLNSSKSASTHPDRTASERRQQINREAATAIFNLESRILTFRIFRI